MFQFARPSIPLGLLHDIVAITPSETFSQANGGQFIPGAKPAETTFKGVIMPVNNEDLQYAPAGVTPPAGVRIEISFLSSSRLCLSSPPTRGCELK